MAGTLLAQRFDASRLVLTGEPAPLAEQVAFYPALARADFSVSENGTLVYGAPDAPNARLMWSDRDGTPLSTVDGAVGYTRPSLSPDEKTIAADRLDPDTQSQDVWLIETRARCRVTAHDQSRARHHGGMVAGRSPHRVRLDARPRLGHLRENVERLRGRARALQARRQAASSGDRLVPRREVDCLWEPRPEDPVGCVDHALDGVTDGRGANARPLLADGVQRTPGAALTGRAMDGLRLGRIGTMGGVCWRVPDTRRPRDTSLDRRRPPAAMATRRPRALLSGSGPGADGFAHKRRCQLRGRRAASVVQGTHRRPRHSCGL